MDGRTQELEIGEDDRDKRKSKRSTQPASRQKIVEHWKAGDWRRLNFEMAGWGMRWEAHDKAMASFRLAKARGVAHPYVARSNSPEAGDDLNTVAAGLTNAQYFGVENQVLQSQSTRKRASCKVRSTLQRPCNKYLLLVAGNRKQEGIREGVKDKRKRCHDTIGLCWEGENLLQCFPHRTGQGLNAVSDLPSARLPGASDWCHHHDKKHKGDQIVQ